MSTKAPKEAKLPKELQDALKVICTQFESEEQSVRERQIRVWKRLDYYWAGFTKVWWNDVAHDWRVWDNYAPEYDYSDDDYYDKEINVFRAYLESIIAALSTNIPGVKGIPDDADNTSDVLTARGATKIAELIYKHVDASLLWTKALWTYTTQGQVFAYNYSDSNKKYGTVEEPDYKDSEEELEIKACPQCGMALTQPVLAEQKAKEANQEDEYDPSAEETLELEQEEDGMLCPHCQATVAPVSRIDKVIVKRLVGKLINPKSRQCIEVLGGLYIQVPNYAACLDDSPYLCYSYETHYTNVYAQYPWLREKMDANKISVSSSSGNENYDRWGRLSTQYRGEYPTDTPTCRNWWLRPTAFEVVGDEGKRKELYKRFPNGCKVVFVNSEFAEAVDEELDDHWTAVKNPLSKYIHFDPLGILLTSIQDITNDLTSLTLQTIEHGIPTTFADPSVLNAEEYRNSEARPGDVLFTKPRPGKAIADGFFQIKTAALSPEVMPFGEKVNQMGQLVSGAMPSIWGGAQAGGTSRTAAQASMSHSQSLQRLQTTWKMFNVWWKDIFGKVIPAYIKNMKEDERIVKEEYGKFVNEIISRSELNGKIGSIELESSDEIPMTWSQVRETVMGLMNSGNPQLIGMLTSPENLPYLYSAIGLNELVVPGDKDRMKQYDEILLLLQSGPIPGPMGQEFPSIQPDQDLDNHQVEAEICRDWLMSETGRESKVKNPQGTKNIFLHFKMHVMFMRMMAPPMQQEPENPNTNQEKPKKTASGMLRKV